jgi:hypothetical protein
VQAAQEYMGKVDDRITRMSTVLPGGTTMRGGTCGILIGAIASMGLKYGSIVRNERALSGKLGLQINDFFAELTREKYGTTNCRDISCCDFTNPEEAKAFKGSQAQHDCAGLLVETMRFLLPIIDRPDATE